MSDMWPRELLLSPSTHKTIFEPKAGGRLYEQTDEGAEFLCAHVVSLVPNKSIELVGPVSA